MSNSIRYVHYYKLYDKLTNGVHTRLMFEGSGMKAMLTVSSRAGEEYIIGKMYKISTEVYERVQA